MPPSYCVDKEGNSGCISLSIILSIVFILNIRYTNVVNEYPYNYIDVLFIKVATKPLDKDVFVSVYAIMTK